MSAPASPVGNLCHRCGLRYRPSCPACGTQPMGLVTDEFEAELARAVSKFPDCVKLPDGTGGSGRKTYETIAKNSCERAYREGRITHADIFEEESAEVLAAETPSAIRKELVQVAAMCLKWIRDIDSRPKENT